MMNELDFMRLCAAAGVLLELPDPDGFGYGERTDILGVPTEIFLDNDMPDRGIVVLELGTVKVEHKIEAYETLLAMQGVLQATHDCVFDHDSIDDVVLLRASLPLSSNITARDLATVIQIFVLQVREWRATLLPGWLEGHDAEGLNAAPFPSAASHVYLA